MRSRFPNSTIVFLALTLAGLGSFTLLPMAHAAQTAAVDQARRSYDKAVALFREGDADGAIDALKKSLGQNPRQADAYHLLGLVYFKGKRNPDEAVQYAIQQIGKPYDFHFNVENGTPVTAYFCHKLTALSLAAGGIKIAPIIKKAGLSVHEVYLADQFIQDNRIKMVYRSAE